MYYDPVKLIALVATFLGWVKLCAWVDLDAKRYRIDGVFWNGMLLLAGMVRVSCSRGCWAAFGSPRRCSG